MDGFINTFPEDYDDDNNTDLTSYLTETIQKEGSGEQITSLTKYISEEEKSQHRSYPDEPVADLDPNLHIDDMPTLLYAEIRRKGIAGHHIKSMNTFYKQGIRQIITEIFKVDHPRLMNERNKTEEDKEIGYISFKVEFTNVNLKPPSTIKYKTRAPQMLTPNMARLKNLTYSAQLYVDAKISAQAFFKNGKIKVREESIKELRIASIPIMLRSDLCNLNNCSSDTLRELEEDPLNPGGYFIIKGGEWAVDSLENILINGFHVYKNMHLNEIARGDIISKPGDAYENSARMLLRYLNNGAITIELQTNKFEKLEIPFFLIFRAFGMTRDYDIINNIVYGVDNTDPITLHMLNILEKAFNTVDVKLWGPVKDSINSNEILLHIATKLNAYITGKTFEKDANAVKFQINDVLDKLDRFIFPHIGLDAQSRIRKLRFLGHLIHKLLRVEQEVLASSDRDNYKNKRIHTAGVSLAKTFKTQFNFSIIQEIRKHLVKDFKSTSFSQVPLADSVRLAINTQDLERALIQSITTGNKTITIKRNEISNRISSQQVYHKNDLNVKSILNNISTNNTSSSKQNERADEMRRVHPSMIGFVCISKSADTGEIVGMKKELACSASVCESFSSYAIKHILLHDIDILNLDDIEPDAVRSFTKVFVNNEWIGLCKNGFNIVHRYRMARRYDVINPFTTIIWEESINEIHFWTDVGRLLRPLVIVYNNLNDYIKAFRTSLDPNASDADKLEAKQVQFKQWIKLTKKHISGLRSGKLSIDDLRKDRIIEYISADEQLNTYLAYNLDILKEHVNDVLNQFTHCDIDQAVLGLVALGSPNANHTMPVRTTHFTNHKKGACGWFTLNWPYRIDKNMLLQYYCEYPIACTFSDSLTYPNGQNAIVAIQIYTGANQEDSSIINKASIDRGLFNGCRFYYEKTELEKGEVFGNIDFARTIDVKKDAVYEFIEDGFIKVGTVVKKGYVLISKYSKIPKPKDDGYLFVDKSVIYKSDEPSIVEEVIVPRNEEDIPVAKVKLRGIRTIQVGDKISSRSGNKNIVSVILPACDMPFSEDGLIPDIIINPDSVPTRMCIGQLMEVVMSEIALLKGSLINATVFKKTDIYSMISWLKTQGVLYAGHRRLYNGKYGNPIDTLIFIGNTYYQRQLKLVADESYAMNSGPTSALTRQPLEGKANSGGLRIGEMEKDVLSALGIARAMSGKLYRDSDYFKIAICRRCQERAIINENKAIYKCKKCRDLADICTVDSSWVANLLFSELQAMGLKLNFELEQFSYSKSE